MNQYVKRTVVSLSVAALTLGATTPVWGSEAPPQVVPINAPVLISAGAGWQGHWAEQDLLLLRAAADLLPEALILGAVDPNEPLPIHIVADLMTYLFGAGGEAGDPLDRAATLGLIRPADFAGGQVPADQPVSRELFALLLTRALQVAGAEDPIGAQTAPRFVDGAEIQTAYRAAVALMQAEGLLIGDDQGRFLPAEPLTYAQAARTAVKASAWMQAKAGKLAGLNPADATYLLDGQQVTLVGGIAEQPAAPGSAAKAVTKLANRLAAGDLNGDGEIDLAAVLTYDGGGSGTFYYLGALQHDGTPVEAVFLGDRIAVQNVRIVEGKVEVDLLTRAESDAMAVRPHIKETRVFEMRDGALEPAEQ